MALRLRAATIAFALLLAVSCEGVDGPAAQNGESTVLPLRTVSQLVPACRDVGFHRATILNGSLSDPELVWLDMAGLGRRRVIWPLGYQVAFAYDFVILDAQGAAVLRGGAAIDGGCVTGEEDTYLLVPPF